jgi:CheY-like chemotaxis protein
MHTEGGTTAMNPHRLSSDLDILLIEDNPGDVRLTEEGFREAKALHNIHVVPDGEQAMAFLRQEGKFTNAPRPDLVLLDLNLPRKDGREVVSEVKQDAALRRIPVIVFTTSRAESDVLASYNAHANCYVTKPVDFDDFLEVIESIRRFWLTFAVLPPK